MCDIEFDGTLGFHEKKHPVARKAHRCVVCRGTIKPGDRYLRESYKWEGEVGSDACCLTCAKDVDAFGDAHGGRPFAGSFLDFLVGCLDERDEESERLWRPTYEHIKRLRGEVGP